MIEDSLLAVACVFSCYDPNILAIIPSGFLYQIQQPKLWL